LGGFDLEEHGSDGDAASDLSQYTDSEHLRAREFLDEVLSSCGWDGDRTEELFDSISGQSTTYLSWWAAKPREIVKKFRAKLQTLLLEARPSARTDPG
jgi:hypothetical protein